MRFRRGSDRGPTPAFPGVGFSLNGRDVTGILDLYRGGGTRPAACPARFRSGRSRRRPSGRSGGRQPGRGHARRGERAGRARHGAGTDPPSSSGPVGRFPTLPATSSSSGLSDPAGGASPLASCQSRDIPGPPDLCLVFPVPPPRDLGPQLPFRDHRCFVLASALLLPLPSASTPRVLPGTGPPPRTAGHGPGFGAMPSGPNPSVDGLRNAP